MKKLLSSFILLLFTFVVFSGNTMMVFAVEEMDISMNMEMKSIWWCSDEDKELYNHECCYESGWISSISIWSNIREENKKIKIKIKSFIDIFSFSLKLYENKNLTKITSPPNQVRKVRNYSYTDLTKIIKSNT